MRVSVLDIQRRTRTQCSRWLMSMHSHGTILLPHFTAYLAAWLQGPGDCCLA